MKGRLVPRTPRVWFRLVARKRPDPAGRPGSAPSALVGRTDGRAGPRQDSRPARLGPGRAHGRTPPSAPSSQPSRDAALVPSAQRPANGHQDCTNGLLCRRGETTAGHVSPTQRERRRNHGDERQHPGRTGRTECRPPAEQRSVWVQGNEEEPTGEGEDGAWRRPGAARHTRRAGTEGPGSQDRGSAGHWARSGVLEGKTAQTWS